MENVEDRKIWIISKGRHVDDIPVLTAGSDTGSVMEYLLSDIARYLLSPDPVEINKGLIWCEIFYKLSSDKFRNLFRRMLFMGPKTDTVPSEKLISDNCLSAASVKDHSLKIHVDRFISALKGYDPVTKRLLKIDQDFIEDVTGICREEGCQEYSSLIINGSVDEKINYICDFLGEEVEVIIQGAHIGNLLFDLRGLSFTHYQSSKSHRLIKFTKDGTAHAFLLGPDNEVEFWIEDIRLLNCMHLLELSIRTNSKLMDIFLQCVQGGIHPLKLMFNRQLEINYSDTRLPEVYRDVLNTCGMDIDKREIFFDLLKERQTGISLQYLPQSGSGNEKIFTHLSVMHDLRVLETIKNDLPQLYSEIHKRASVSEDGRFYLLDSLREYEDV